MSFARFSARAVHDSQGTDDWCHSSNNSVQPPLITRRNERDLLLLKPYLHRAITPASTTGAFVERARGRSTRGAGRSAGPSRIIRRCEKKMLPVKGHLGLIHRRAFISAEKLISSLRERATNKAIIILDVAIVPAGRAAVPQER